MIEIASPGSRGGRSVSRSQCVTVARGASEGRNVPVGVNVFGKHPARPVEKQEQLPAFWAQPLGMLFDHLTSLFEGKNPRVMRGRHFGELMVSAFAGFKPAL
jgi:hypothetical protein